MKKATRVYTVAGVTYRQEEIASLLDLNSDYKLSKNDILENDLEDEDIYKYYPKTCTAVLEEEPDNKWDPNAVKVVIDQKLVGYIKKEQAPHIKSQLAAGNIINVNAKIMGGPSKRLEETDDDKYTLEKDDDDLYISLSVVEMIPDEAIDTTVPAPVTHADSGVQVTQPAKKPKKFVYILERIISIVVVLLTGILSLMFFIVSETVLGIIFLIITVVMFRSAKKIKNKYT